MLFSNDNLIFRFALLQPVALTAPDMYVKFTHIKVILFCLCIIIIHISIDPDNFIGNKQIVSLVVMWSIGSAIYLATHFVLIALVTYTSSIFSFVGRYNTFFGCFFATLTATVVMILIAPSFGSETAPDFDDFWSILPISTLRMLVFEWLFYEFFILMPYRSTRVATLPIGDRDIDINELLYVKAQQHHIQITTRTEQFSERGRMKDFLKLLDADFGIQPHRSFWVSKDAIESAFIEHDRLTLVVSQGDQINVARNRKSNVMDWLQKNGLMSKITVQ